MPRADKSREEWGLEKGALQSLRRSAEKIDFLESLLS